MLELRGPIHIELILRRGGKGLPASAWAGIIGKLAEFVNEFRVAGDEPVAHPELLAILEALDRTRKFYHLYTPGQWDDPDRFLADLRRFSYFGSFVFDFPGHTPDLYRQVRGEDGHGRLVSPVNPISAKPFERERKMAALAAMASVRASELAEGGGLGTNIL